MLRRLAIIIIVLSTFATSNVQAQKKEAEQLFEWFKSASGFDRTYPREKVYLHMDNASYLEGDTLWYKAYVVRASSLLPTELSKVLYVELLNADGQLVERQTLHLDSLAQADGCFQLNIPIRAGYYEVRAYTREMTNWDETAYFSRIIPIFAQGGNPLKRKGSSINFNLGNLFVPNPERNERVTLGEPRPYTMKESRDCLLTFYPEGGKRAKQLKQVIAFKLTDGRGYALEDTLCLYNSNGHFIQEFAPEYEGMGSFVLPDTIASAYVCRKNIPSKKYVLPDAETSYALHTQVADSGLYVKASISPNVSHKGQLMGIAVTCREKVCYFDTLTLSTSDVDLFIPRKALRGGVNRIDLFDVNGHSWITRLVWMQPTTAEDKRVKVAIEQNEAVYAPFSPSVLKMHLSDLHNKPVKTTFSISVRDRHGNITDTNDGGIKANLLLSSELRGYVYRPDLYFAKDDAAHRRMLDLLLMVQGWTANSFDVMCGADSFNLKQPIEDKLIIRGTLLEDNNKHKPLANFKLKISMYSPSGMSMDGETTTDANGKFAFESKINFSGEYMAQFSARSTSGKKRWARLTIDRWYAPSPRALNITDLLLHAPAQYDSIHIYSQVTEPNTFIWKDTIPHALPKTLTEAKVVVKGKYKGFTGGRYTWNGGEKTGQKVAMKYYDIMQISEYLKDHGEATSDMGDLLPRLNPKLDIYRSLDENATNNDYYALDSTSIQSKLPSSYQDYHEQDKRPHMTYGNNYVQMYNNNMADYKYTNDIFDTPSDEFRSWALVTDGFANNAVTGERERNSQWQYKSYFYEQPDKKVLESKKGTERRRIHGFTPHVEFYSPDYRRFDLPSDADVRRTLYWNPSIKSDDEGNALIIFFTNSHKEQRLDISIRGVTLNGGWVE